MSTHAPGHTPAHSPGRAPGNADIRVTRRLLRTLSSTRQFYTLYPTGHPRRQEAARELRDAVNELRDARGGPAVLFVSERNFYLGPMLLAWESLTHHRLAASFEEAGVQSIEFLEGVDEVEADALMRLVAGEVSAHDELRAISINRAGPNAPATVQGSFTDLLQSYASGLELLRQTAARLLAGRPADLDATVRLTEHLADLIADDPAQALLLTTVKSYDEYTYHHMVNVCILTLALARAIGLPHERAIALGIGGLLHDVGKVRVPQEVLQHDGALDEEQWRQIRRHPIDGAGLILVTTRDPLHPAVSVVLEHHAAYDGSGYPSLSGHRSPSAPARLVAVADSFDALTSKRSYRKPEERRQALSLLQAGAGRSYDPRIVRTFVRLLGVFPMGSLVQLSAGEIAVVVRNHERMLARPTVRVVLDRHGNEVEPVDVDLSERDSRGEFLRSVQRSIDPVDVGVEMLSLLASGRLDVPPPEEVGPGLVHDPAPGEAVSQGFVPEHD
jgi:HD-GYP domain-containing protein (c-di-GMP phosphodiesterase class II)